MEVPLRNDVAIRSFCKINHFQSPYMVRVAPQVGCTVANCFLNVRKIVSERGGRELNGWIIWRAPKLFLEAEHHCVWQSPNGEVLDVTPKARGEAAIRFAPQPKLGFDYEGLNFQKSRYQNLSGSPFIDALISLSLERQTMMTENVFMLNGELKCSFDPKKAEELLTSMIETFGLAQREVG